MNVVVPAILFLPIFSLVLCVFVTYFLLLLSLRASFVVSDCFVVTTHFSGFV